MDFYNKYSFLISITISSHKDNKLDSFLNERINCINKNKKTTMFEKRKLRIGMRKLINEYKKNKKDNINITIRYIDNDYSVEYKYYTDPRDTSYIFMIL